MFTGLKRKQIESGNRHPPERKQRLHETKKPIRPKAKRRTKTTDGTVAGLPFQRGMPYVGEENIVRIKGVEKSRFNHKRGRELLLRWDDDTLAWTHECEVSEDVVSEWDEAHPETVSPDEEEYPVETKRGDTTKQEINDLFVRAVRKMKEERGSGGGGGRADQDDEASSPSPADDNVLVLDSSDFRTTRLLVDHADVTHVTVTNPFVCRQLQKRLVQYHDNPRSRQERMFAQRVRVIPLYVGTFLASLHTAGPPAPSPFTAVWLDYHGCWTGNRIKGIIPKDEVFGIIRHNLMATPSILAITYSRRCPPGARATHEDIFNDITRLNAKYCIQELYHLDYGLSMSFVMYRIDSVGVCVKRMDKSVLPKKTILFESSTPYRP